MADFYVDAVNGFDGGDNLPETPWATIAYTMDNGFGDNDGDRLFLSGTFREQIRLYDAAGHALNSITIKQWEGMPQAVLRGDTPTALADWTYASTAGVFDLTIAADTLAWWDDGGTHRTLTEGVVSVVVNWDTSIDQYGRHFGHLKQSSTATAGDMDDNSWYFTPATPAGSGGGGGTLRIKLAEGYTSDAALEASGLVISYCKGNQNGIEIGTPTYTTYPTWGAYNGTNVNNLLVEGLHLYLWCDSGYRKNKPLVTGAGDDSSAYGAGNVRGTVSIGYGIRVADAANCTMRGLTIIDSGYHAYVWAGDHCSGNVMEDIKAWGGGVNPFSGGSTSAVYTGPGAGFNNDNDVYGCRISRCVNYRYTLLGRDGLIFPHPLAGDDAGTVADTYCAYDGIICHTNARGGSISSVASGTGGVARVTTNAAHNMYTGERVTIYGASAGDEAYNGTWTITVIDSTKYELTGSTFGSTATATWYSKSNIVRDVLVEDTQDIQFGTRANFGACHGQAFIGGGRSEFATNRSDWRTFPVRYVRCKMVNAATNLLSGDGDTAFYQCRFEMDRAGQDATDADGVYLGAAMGAFSGANCANFTSCEIVSSLASTSNATRHLFYITQVSTPVYGSLRFINTSVYNRGTTADGPSNLQYFFVAVNVAATDGADRVYARQSIFQHQWCPNTTDLGRVVGATVSAASNAVTSTAHGLTTGQSITVSGSTCTPTIDGARTVTVTGVDTFTVGVEVTVDGVCNYTFAHPVRGLVQNARSGFGDTGSTNWNVRDCAYGNITTGQYITYGGGAHSLGAEANYITYADTDGVYYGQDPTAATIATGTGTANPFADVSGRTLELSGSAAARDKRVSPHAALGINGREYSGQYGAHQLGDEPEVGGSGGWLGRGRGR